MNQEDKELLLKDLCARLPYDTVVYYKTDGWESQYDTLSPQVIDNMVHRFDIIVKPYLRPMNSMTEEEKEELADLGLAYWDSGKHTDEDGYTIIYGGKEIQLLPYIETYDWLNRHHFDNRGLIEKGLALEAQKDMYKEV